MKLQSPKLIDRGDLPGASPELMRVVQAYNRNFERQGEAIQKVPDRERRELVVEHGVEFTYTLQTLSRPPVCVRIDKVVSRDDSAEIQWKNEGFDITATVFFRTGAAGDVTVTITAETD